MVLADNHTIINHAMSRITKTLPPLVNRIAYVFFIIIGIYTISYTDDLMQGVSNLGVALIFDPFNQEKQWSDRPFYQRAWLIVHVTAVIVLLGIAFWKS